MKQLVPQQNAISQADFSSLLGCSNALPAAALYPTQLMFGHLLLAHMGIPSLSLQLLSF